MTANLLTAGHIRVLKWLNKNYSGIIIGLLTSEALKGYKEEIVPFEERYEILQMITDYMGFVLIPQTSLDPSSNIEMLKPDCLASGDGFEKCELDAAIKYKLELVNIKLRGEREKKYSSSDIINKIKNI